MTELQRQGIQLTIVSIGLPEKGQALLNHLGLEDALGNDTLFVDPENALYNALDLNRGVQRTFFTIDTPFAFLDRFTRRDGTRELGQVLSKWLNGAVYIPPKQEQGLLQGGVFVFQRFPNKPTQTLLAHYDPSTAAHASIDRVMDIARTAQQTTTTTTSGIP